MILEKFLIKGFADKPKSHYVVSVPDNSVFTHVVKVMPDGIYAFYRVNKVFPSDFTRLDVFMIIKSGEDIPSDFDLVDILDVMYQTPFKEGEPMQDMMLFPIFKKA